MNAHATFNALTFVRRLETAGMDSRQAEALAEALGEIVFETTATKSDIRELELKIAGDLRELELRINSQLRDQEIRGYTRLGAVVGGATALTVAILGAPIALH